LSKSTKPRSRTQLSRAAIKAYEARRAEEVNRVEADAATISSGPVVTGTSRRGFAISRVEEIAIIRSDLRRLGLILAFLTVLLVVATLFLR
jgi:hypothetical protein